MSAYAKLVARGCLCGGENPTQCPLHKAGDNRGLAALFKAGMPQVFPTPATCGVCDAEGLMYPSVELDRGEIPAGECPGPTLICPNCSPSTAEWLLRHRAADFGYELNSRTVFDLRPVPVRNMQALLDKAPTDEALAECHEALAECWYAVEGGSDSTADFERGEDGRLVYEDGGPRPSYALALLFDNERFMRSESTALDWEQVA